MAVERELKFEADNDLALPDLTALVPGARLRAVPAKRLEATYFDTADLRLVRWGVTLRSRPEDGAPRWTLKLAASDDRPDLRARHELQFEGEDRATAAPPSDALDLVTAFARTSALGPVARLVTRRMPFVLEAEDGTRLAEVDDDEVTAYRGKQVVARFREVEVELADGADAALVDGIKRRFRKAGAAPAARSSKVMRALVADGADEPTPEIPSGPSGGQKGKATAGGLAAAAIAAGVRRLIVHDPLVRLGADIEAVHQARVATRRLRSDLRTFSPFLDTAWVEAVGAESAALGRVLGAVRDADVLSERLYAAVARLPEGDRAGASKLLALLARERDAARTLLLEELRRESYRVLLERLVLGAQSPPLAADAGRRAAGALRPIVGHRFKAVAKRVDRLDGTDGALHEVRIAAKRCRYAAEASVAVLGDSADALAQRMADVQTVLGEHQDAVVAGQWLRQAAATPRLGPAAVLAAGELLAAEGQAAADAAAAFPKAWRKAAKAGRAFAKSG